MHVFHIPPDGLRRRRWLRVLAVCAVFAASYGLALRWLALRVENDIGKAIHPVPAVMADHQGHAD